MWSGSCSAEPTAKSLLAGPAEDLTPWWELDSRLAEFQRARPRYVNALSLCQRRPAAPAPPPKRARPAPLLPLSPKLKRARSLASVESFHDLDAAHALAELVSA